MPTRDEMRFQEAMLDTYRRAKAEARYNPALFLKMVSEQGGVEAARTLLRSPNVSDGFTALWERKRLDLAVEALVLAPEWRSLFSDEERSIARRRLEAYGYTAADDRRGDESTHEPLSLQQIVDELNRRADRFQVGALQELRKQIHRGERLAARTIFPPQPQNADWAFHVGGRREMQYNVGFEYRAGTQEFRHGVAFSLERSQWVQDVVEALLPKIDRFNEFFRLYPGAYPEMRMWYYQGGSPSEDFVPGPIAPNVAMPETFIFLGKRQGVQDIGFDDILRDYDRLLPLYRYVEGDDGSFPHLEEGAPGLRFVPGHTTGKLKTQVTLQEQVLDVNLRHSRIQHGVYRFLARRYGSEAVGTEVRNGPGNRIDVVVKRPTGYWFYEIKPGLSARSCIRQALSQLLEYSYWPTSDEAERLIIVGEAQAGSEETRFLALLRERFGLPLWYQQYDEPVELVREEW